MTPDKNLLIYVVNSNSAHQVQFTECKSSHAGVKNTQQLSQGLAECLVNYKVPLSWSEEITVTRLRLFLICRSWSTVSMLMPIVPFSYGVWPFRFRFRFSFIELVAKRLKIKKLNKQ